MENQCAAQGMMAGQIASGRAPENDPRPAANCDQEAWVQQSVVAAMRMAIALQKQQNVRAEEYLVEYGLAGIAEGAAREIIQTLGMRPEFVNIRKFNKP